MLVVLENGALKSSCIASCDGDWELELPWEESGMRLGQRKIPQSFLVFLCRYPWLVSNILRIDADRLCQKAF